MDENKKYKRPKRSSASLDGIVFGGRRLGEPVGKSGSSGKLMPVISDVANQIDGFHAARNAPQSLDQFRSVSPEADEAHLLDEPIILDDIQPAKKRRYFGRPRPRLHKNLKRVGLGVSALILIVGAYFGIKLYITERHLFRGGGGAPALAEKVDINKLKGEGDGRINILLLGIGGPGHDGPDLTDTMMIASVDPVNNKIALLSIPRDLWVKIPGNGYQKINAAYPDGKMESKSKTNSGKVKDGLKLLDQTLEPVIGIPIHYHAVVDFSAFKDMVDALGGVNVNVTQQLYDPTIAWENHWNPVIAKVGEQTMHGQQALLYARSRETSSDFARGQRQRQLLVAVKDKALSLGTFSNPVKISNLLTSLGNNIYTDFNLNDMTRMYQITQKIPSNDITSLDLVTPPHAFLTTAPVNGLSTVQPRAGMFNYSAIQDYIRNTLRDGFIAKENASVAVYNATNVAGLAKSKATLLKSYGYSVTTVDNAPNASNPQRTVVVDLTKGKDKYTRHYLEGRFNVTAINSLPTGSGLTPPAGTDFVIILGEDATTSG